MFSTIALIKHTTNTKTNEKISKQTVTTIAIKIYLYTVSGFLSTILSSVLISTSVFLLGIFQTDAIVGGYAANDKLIKAVLLMFAPITNAIYPNISYELSISEKDGIKSIKKYAIPIVLLSTVISLFFIIFNQNILGFFFNTEILEYKSAFIILAIWIPVSVLNNFIGIQYLCGSGKSKLYG